MKINDVNKIKINGITDIISEILNLYEKIPNKYESEEMIHSFMDKYKLTNDDKALVIQNLENLKILNFNKETILNFIQQKIENRFNLDSENSNIIVIQGLQFLKIYVEIAKINQKTEILKAQNQQKEVEFNNYLTKLNIEINLEIEAKKQIINEYGILINNSLVIDDFISASYNILNKTEDRDLVNKKNNQIDDFLNGNLNTIIEL